MFDAFKIDQFDVLGEGEPVPAAFAGEIQRKWEVAEPFGEGRELGRQAGWRRQSTRRAGLRRRVLVRALLRRSGFADPTDSATAVRTTVDAVLSCSSAASRRLHLVRRARSGRSAVGRPTAWRPARLVWLVASEKLYLDDPPLNVQVYLDEWIYFAYS